MRVSLDLLARPPVSLAPRVSSAVTSHRNFWYAGQLQPLSYPATDHLQLRFAARTRKAQEDKIADTTRNVLDHWITRSTAFSSGSEYSAKELEDNIRTYGRQELAGGFARLDAKDAESVIKRLSSAFIPTALQSLETQGRIVVNTGSSKSRAGRRYTISRTSQQTKPCIESLEQILLRNLPWTRRLELDILSRIRSNDYPVGYEFPLDMTLDGEPLTRGIRSTALANLCKAGYLEVVYEPGARKGGLASNAYRVIPHTPPPPQIQFANMGVVPLLYDMTRESGGITRATTIPTNNALGSAYEKDPGSFSRAKRILAKAGLLTQGSGGEPVQPTFYVTNTKTPQEMAAVIRQHSLELHRYIESLLMHVSNADKSKCWSSQGDMAKLIEFSDKIKPGSQRAKMNFILNHLNEAPVPLIYYFRGTNPLQPWLNPSVDYDLLKTTLSQLYTHPIILASGALFNLSPWQMPCLYHAQVHTKPTVWLNHSTDGNMTLEMGLTDTESASTHPFKSLNSLPPTHSCPIPPANPTTVNTLTTNAPPLDQHHYGTFFLKQLSQLYPLPQWDTLKSQPSVSISADEAQALYKLKAPLEKMGYLIHLP